MLSFLQKSVLFFGLMILTVSVPSRLQAAGGSAIVDQGWLLGGFFQQKWLPAAHTAKRLKGGETYQLCTLYRFLGKARGSKPKPNPEGDVGPEFGITFNPPFRNQEPVVAVGGSWNAMPRRPHLLRENLQPYAEAAAEILKRKGIANPQVNLTQVIEIDLEGDGSKEVLVCARRFTMLHPSDDLQDGDYSMVFLQKKAGEKTRNILIEGQFKAASQPEPGPPLTFRLAGLVDADGDGILEILVDYTYYEGGGARLYQLKGDKVKKVLSEDWGA